MIIIYLLSCQLVTLAVYSYFFAAIFGAQWVQPEDNQSYRALYSIAVGTTGARLDLFYPIFLTLQFAFFVGWLKVSIEVVEIV